VSNFAEKRGYSDADTTLFGAKKLRISVACPQGQEGDRSGADKEGGINFGRLSWMAP